MPHRPYQRGKIDFVGKGFPKQKLEKLVEPEMSVPIFPATMHPLGREPLRTNRPFPFADCYQHFVQADVRIPTQEFDTESATMLGLDHMFRHSDLYSADVMRYFDRKRIEDQAKVSANCDPSAEKTEGLTQPQRESSLRCSSCAARSRSFSPNGDDSGSESSGSVSEHSDNQWDAQDFTPGELGAI